MTIPGTKVATPRRRFANAFLFPAATLYGMLVVPWWVPLLGLWLLARLAFLVWPGSWFAIGTVGLFALGVAARVVPRFGQAKKWRNRTVAPVMAGLALLAMLGSVSFATEPARDVLLVSLVALSVLLFFMGGAMPSVHVAGLLMSAAAVCRLAYALPPLRDEAVAILTVSAICWSASLMILLVVLVRTLVSDSRPPRAASAVG